MLKTMLPFGILECLVIHLIHSNVMKLVNLLNSTSQMIIVITILLI